MSYDVIIIGGGLGGLTAGAVLAKSKKEFYFLSSIISLAVQLRYLKERIFILKWVCIKWIMVNMDMILKEIYLIF